MPGIIPLELDFTVRGFDSGYGGPYSPLALANLLQEAASDHADLIGFGGAAMNARGLTWMLSRIDLRLLREPKRGERLVARTWPAGFERLFALRDFELDSRDSGEPVARASYAYLVVDLAARRPVRAQNAIDPGLVCERPRALSDARFSAERPADEGAWRERYELTAMDRHIDHNGHVNNAHLIAWLCDAPPPEARSGGALAELRVEFAQEALLGDRLSAVWAPLPARDGLARQAAELRRGDDSCVRGELAWR